MLCILLYSCFDVVFPDVQVLKFVIARRYYAEVNVLRYSSTSDLFPFSSMRKFLLANIVTYHSSLFCHCRSSWPLLGIGKKCQTISEKKSRKNVNKERPRGIGPRRFSPFPRGAKYSTVTQDMSPSGVNF